MRAETAANINHCWARLIVEELLRRGVAGFVLSPGSRNTPLTMAVVENPEAARIMHFDERGAAFYALGWAKESGKPVALICTSGTATANYLPAIIEAAQSQVPLIVLTADRPPELIGCGANQAIIQPGLYGDYVRYAETLPCPSLDVPPEQILSTIEAACDAATGMLPGPVHLNCRFREPLAATPEQVDLKAYLAPLRSWLSSDAPYRDAPAASIFQGSDQNELLTLIREAEKGLLIVGRLDTIAEQEAVRTLVERLGWPVFADVTSGLRLHAATPPFLPYYDQQLLSESFRQQCQPDTVLQIGGAFTSKRLLEHLDTFRPRYALLNGNTYCQDPNHQLTDRYTAPIALACHALVEAMPSSTASPWLSDCTEKIESTVDAWITAQETLTEIALARIISRYAPAESALFLGNSMPIRDMDMFGMATGNPKRVFANRGASGIDGTMATAAGLSKSASGPVTAILGDLACLHDLNSLALLRDCSVPLVLVIINNNGGGIFHFLPVADGSEQFESCFGTPHGLDFKQAAAQFGLPYRHADSVKAFEEAYTEALTQPGATVLEVTTDRRDNQIAHEELQRRVTVTIDNILTTEKE